LRHAGADSFESLIEILQQESASPDIRLSACWLAGQLQDKRAVGPLLAVLAREAGLCWEAAKALGIIGSKRAAPRLAAMLAGADDTETRAAAAYALGLLCDARSTAPLLNALSDTGLAPKVRGHAAEALGYLRDAAAVDALVAALRDAHAEVRYWAAFALGEIGDRRALPELRRLAATDQARLHGGETVSHAAEEAAESISAGEKTDSSVSE
jgi:HEAT repeat protein